jgi:RNA polymerase sigma-70 factor (ECF subfamily)
MPGPAQNAVVIPLLREGSSTTDREWVERAQRGERFALQVLYTRHVRAVSARVTRLLARSADAEDVVQDAFMLAFRDLANLADAQRFGGWLMGIAVHQAHRRFRRRRLLARFGLDRGTDDAQLAQLAHPGLGPDRLYQLAELDRELARLSAELRVTWMLRHVEGCELGEVAEQCGCSLATVKRRLHRAEQLLSSWLLKSAARAEAVR